MLPPPGKTENARAVNSLAFSEYERSGHKAKSPPDLKVRRTKTAEKFRQLAAAPEPIISPDAEVMMIARAAPQAAANAQGVAETAGVNEDDMRG